MDSEVRLARHRLATSRRHIPDRHDRAADELEKRLALAARYGLAETLQPAPSARHISVQELPDAAAQIRTAANHIARIGVETMLECGPAGPDLPAPPGRGAA